MKQNTSHPIGDISRRRKSHRKSRAGCRNCKLRRIKCDETLPFCTKCTTYGYVCNYDRKTLDLQMACDQPAIMKTPFQQLPQNNINSLEIQPLDIRQLSLAAGKLSSLGIDEEMLGRLVRFHERTVLSIGTEESAKIFRKVAPQILFSHPYVMHIIQTLTGVHDRQLSAPLTSRQTTSEMYHLSQAASLFNKSLSRTVEESDRDPLWIAAAMLGITAFAWIDATSPEEAWPLAEGKPYDLDWIRMSELKPAVWDLTNPLRPSSAFSRLNANYATLGSGKSSSRVEDVPISFAELFNVDECSTVENNPYHAAVLGLSPLLEVHCDRPNILLFLSFISHLYGGFKRLLEAKDPRALLLLAYWFAKVCKSVWWIERRSIMEGQAVCLYLEKYHSEKKRIQDMLQFPKRILGAAALVSLSSIPAASKD